MANGGQKRVPTGTRGEAPSTKLVLVEGVPTGAPGRIRTGATGSGGRALLLVRLLLPFELAIHGSSPVRARIAFSARSRSSRKSAGTFRLLSSSAKRRRNSIPAVWPWLAWSLCSGS